MQGPVRIGRIDLDDNGYPVATPTHNQLWEARQRKYDYFHATGKCIGCDQPLHTSECSNCDDHTRPHGDEWALEDERMDEINRQINKRYND